MRDPIDTVERLAGMSADHGPDGWPAVQMRDISALCAEITRLRAELAETHELARDQFDLRAEQRDDRDRLRAAISAAQVPQWLPIESAPKDGRKIIVAYVNHNGKSRTVMARWLTDEEAAETDGDGVGLEGGWYECIDNWSDYTEVAIHEGEPTHYMPLPAAPGASPPAALAVPDGWTVRDRSDLEAGAIDLTSPTTGRVVLLPAHRDAHSRTLYELAAAMLAAQMPQPAAPTEHRQGCDALGGYGHGIGPYTCGFDAQPAALAVPDDRRPHSARTHKDALRYRWLRSEDGSGRVTEFWKRACLDEALTLECLDRAIDAEMAVASPQAPQTAPADTQAPAQEQEG